VVADVLDMVGIEVEQAERCDPRPLVRSDAALASPEKNPDASGKLQDKALRRTTSGQAV
jgi:hypothetical protein